MIIEVYIINSFTSIHGISNIPLQTWTLSPVLARLEMANVHQAILARHLASGMSSSYTLGYSRRNLANFRTCVVMTSTFIPRTTLSSTKIWRNRGTNLLPLLGLEPQTPTIWKQWNIPICLSDGRQNDPVSQIWRTHLQKPTWAALFWVGRYSDGQGMAKTH